MSVGVIVELVFEPGVGASLLEERMRFTRSYDGSEYEHLYQDSENPDRYVLVQRWESRAKYDSYWKWAMEQSGTGEMMSQLSRDMTTQYLEETVV